MEAAAVLFRDKGYSATSMRDLAESVQLKASSLYNHISGKEEILKTICFQNAKVFHEELATLEASTLSSTEKVEQLVRFHIVMATEEVTSITSFNDEWRHLTEPDLSRFKELRKDYEHRFKGILKAGIKEGIFKNIDPTILLHTVLSSIRWVYDWYRIGRPCTPDELAREITEIVLSGIRR
ncbi:MAG: TetR/AcrR family transcriptional regulator [Saprospiraceae bacterium]|nr:TetR/AcrR family transcriptional regulator [Saprospiraceae bacterium]